MCSGLKQNLSLLLFLFEISGNILRESIKIFEVLCQPVVEFLHVDLIVLVDKYIPEADSSRR